MSVPPFGATGMDKSDAGTYGGGPGQLAASSMGAPDTMREALSDAALDRAVAEVDPTAPRTLDATMALKMYREANSQARSFFTSSVRPKWDRNYRAYRGEHYAGSKYLSEEYRSRSKIFKPKTRSAIRKNLATTAKAMFATSDVVSISAQDETDPRAQAAAALKQHIINFHLSNDSLRRGVPWFLIASGSRFDAQMTGMPVSKQVWTFKEEETGEDELVLALDVETGEQSSFKRPKMRTVIDKPEIVLIAPENVRFSPTAPWHNVAQLSSFLMIDFPMSVDDAYTMMSTPQRDDGGPLQIPWRPMSIETLTSIATAKPDDTTSTRAARDGGRDPQQQMAGRFADVWLTETFMRFGGKDYVFWTINDTTLISDPVPTAQAYPAMFGERPIVIGKGQLEPHRSYVMSAAESWQDLQLEANDLSNLRLDHQKQIVRPGWKIKRGTNVDLRQIQRGGPNAMYLLKDPGDLEPMQMPDTPPGAFQESSIINADFDDLAGNFDSGSVQANRQLNETVGGMHLMSEATNAVADFDLSVWSETWVSPVLEQVLRLVEMYETDETVLAICGQRAKLWEKFGISEITDELLQAETTVKINVGIGAASMPMEKLKKFSVAWDTSAKALAPFISSGVVSVKPNAQNIVDTIFGAAGFQDAGAMFFEFIGDGQGQPPNPHVAKAQADADVKKQQLAVEQEKNQSQAMIQARKLNDDRASLHQKLIADAHDRVASIQIADLKVKAEAERAHVAAGHESAFQAREHAHNRSRNLSGMLHEALRQRLMPTPPPDSQMRATKAAIAPTPKQSAVKDGMFDNLGAGSA